LPAEDDDYIDPNPPRSAFATSMMHLLSLLTTPSLSPFPAPSFEKGPTPSPRQEETPPPKARSNSSTNLPPRTSPSSEKRFLVQICPPATYYNSTEIIMEAECNLCKAMENLQEFCDVNIYDNLQQWNIKTDLAVF
jgi:hypothetical protein